MHHRHSLNTRDEHLGGDVKKLSQADLCFALFIQQELLASHSQDPPCLSGDRYPERTRDRSGTVESSMSEILHGHSNSLVLRFHKNQIQKSGQN